MKVLYSEFGGSILYFGIAACYMAAILKFASGIGIF